VERTRLFLYKTFLSTRSFFLRQTPSITRRLSSSREVPCLFFGNNDPSPFLDFSSIIVYYSYRVGNFFPPFQLFPWGYSPSPIIFTRGTHLVPSLIAPFRGLPERSFLSRQAFSGKAPHHGPGRADGNPHAVPLSGLGAEAPSPSTGRSPLNGSAKCFFTDFSKV